MNRPSAKPTLANPSPRSPRPCRLQHFSTLTRISVGLTICGIDPVVDRYQDNKSPADVKKLIATEVAAPHLATPSSGCPIFSHSRNRQTRLPCALKQVDDVSDAADRPGILHQGHLFHDRFGEQREIALMHADVAEARGATEIPHQGPYTIHGGPGRFLRREPPRVNAGGLGDEGQAVGSRGQVELHGMGKHDTRSLPMRHMTMPAQLMPDGM